MPRELYRNDVISGLERFFKVRVYFEQANVWLINYTAQYARMRNAHTFMTLYTQLYPAGLAERKRIEPNIPEDTSYGTR